MKILAALLLASVLVLPALPARAELRGEAAVTFDANVCLPNDLADCHSGGTSILLHVGFSVWGGLRFIDYLGAYLDLDVGGYSIDGLAGPNYNLHLVGGVRGFFPHELFEAFVGVALGLGHINFADKAGPTASYARWNGLAVKVTFGGGYKVMENLVVGAHLDFFAHAYGETCKDVGAGATCRRLDDGEDVQHSMLLGLLAKYSFE